MTREAQTASVSRAFYHGFAAALGSLAREHDRPSMAIDIMRCNGVTLQNLKDAGVEQFDLAPLAKEWKWSAKHKP